MQRLYRKQGLEQETLHATSLRVVYEHATIICAMFVRRGEAIIVNLKIHNGKIQEQIPHPISPCHMVGLWMERGVFCDHLYPRPQALFR